MSGRLRVDVSVQKPHSVWLLAAETENRVWVGTVEDQVPQTQVSQEWPAER